MKVTYKNNADLETVRSEYQGNRLINNKYVNEGETEEPFLHWRTLLKWQLSSNPKKAEKKLDNFSIEVITDTSFLANNKNVIIWFGHSSVYVRINGISIFFDPCFYDITNYKRKVQFPDILHLLPKLDYILISHAHPDHLDIQSIKQILKFNEHVKFLIPLDIASYLIEEFQDIEYQEAGWYQKYQTVSGIEIVFLPAKHWHMRGLFDFNKGLWGGFYIKSENKSIFYSGDTAEGSHFGEIAEFFPSPDICLMPIGAYEPRFVMKNVHHSPEECVDAFNVLKGHTFIPIHYGTYDLADELLGDPIKEILDLNNSRKLNKKLVDLKVGELFYFNN